MIILSQTASLVVPKSVKDRKKEGGGKRGGEKKRGMKRKMREKERRGRGEEERIMEI